MLKNVMSSPLDELLLRLQAKYINDADIEEATQLLHAASSIEECNEWRREVRKTAAAHQREWHFALQRLDLVISKRICKEYYAGETQSRDLLE